MSGLCLIRVPHACGGRRSLSGMAEQDDGAAESTASESCAEHGGIRGREIDERVDGGQRHLEVVAFGRM
jgi:hypothetical protein